MRIYYILNQLICFAFGLIQLNGYTIHSYNRVGGGVAPAVLSHHRTYGSVYGGFYPLLPIRFNACAI